MDAPLSPIQHIRAFLDNPRQFFESIDLLLRDNVTCIIRDMLQAQKEIYQEIGHLKQRIATFSPTMQSRALGRLSHRQEPSKLKSLRLLFKRKGKLEDEVMLLQRFLNGICLGLFCKRVTQTLPLEVRELIHLFVLESRCAESDAILPFNFCGSIMREHRFPQISKAFMLPIVEDRYLVGSVFFHELTITWYRNTTVEYYNFDDFIGHVHKDRWNTDLDPARHLHRIAIHYTMFQGPDQREIKKAQDALKLFREVGRPNAKLTIIMQPPSVNLSRRYEQQREIETPCHSKPTIRRDGKPDEVVEWSETRKTMLVPWLQDELGDRCRYISFITYTMTYRLTCIHCYPKATHDNYNQQHRRCVYEETLGEFTKRERLPKKYFGTWIV